MWANPLPGTSAKSSNAVITRGESVTLNAVVQPIMSQTTRFVLNIYGSDRGLLAAGSPALTKRVKFYENGILIGTARLSAKGTLATLVLTGARRGSHVYIAPCRADEFYNTLNFGSVNVQVK